MKNVYSMLSGVFTVLLLTACGGGGGDVAGVAGITGNTGLGLTVTAGVNITALNAPNVAAAVLNGVAAGAGSANGVASAPPLITGVAVNASAGHFSLPGLLLDQFARVPGLQNSPNNTAIVGAVLSQNLSCTNGGSATLSANIADPLFMTLTAGDILSVSFFLCDEIGVEVDGDLAMEVFAIALGDPFSGFPPYDITLDVDFSALRALDGIEYYYWIGDMRQDLVDDGAGNIRAILSGNSLDTSYNKQYPLSTAYHDQRLTAYQFDLSGDENTGDFSIDLDGTVESLDIDGTVTFTTTAPGAATFSGNDFLNNGDPTAGTLLAVSDLDGSQLRLTALAGGAVLIEVDPEGDNIYEQPPILTTWAALEAL